MGSESDKKLKIHVALDKYMWDVTVTESVKYSLDKRTGAAI